MKRALLLALALGFLLILARHVLADSFSVYTEGGPSVPVIEGLGDKEVPDASLRMITAQRGHVAIYAGVVERLVSVDTTLRTGTGEVFTLDAELPARFGFFGADFRADTGGNPRLEAGMGLALFDKLDSSHTNTIWQFHLAAYGVIDFEPLQLRLGLHHFSNGRKYRGSPGPNRVFEFATLGVGIVVPL